MKHVTLALILIIAFPLFAIGQDFTIVAADRNHISLHFELNEFRIDTVRCNGELMHSIATKGIMAPNEYGLPNLPTFNRFIAIPQGARAEVQISTSRDERLSGINIVPSIGSQCENEEERPFFKDQRIYAANSFYPTEAVRAAEPQSLRGVDVIHLGVCPVQFNPVTREIDVHRQIDIDIRFEGGNGHFGDDRLRSRFWDPIWANNILNYNCLEPIDYDTRMQEWSRTRATGCEYLIMTPDNESYVEAALTLADFRLRQGILTKVMRVTETGATNTRQLIEWFRNIYNEWDIPPAAVCLIGESGDDLHSYVPGVRTAHPKDGYITSDNPYADVNDDNLPDICFTRLIAQTNAELPIFIGKQLEYEYTDVVTDANYYAHPLTAAGWQNDKWFQISIANISGYLTQHGKNPTRINEIYNGDLGPNWSTAPGSAAVVSYFGPEGLGYIPATPAELGGWTGGNAEQVIHAFNAGAYLVQHRDHGWNTKWYQPEIYTTDFGEINNAGKMTYLISINCRTGMYDASQTCFTEALIRMIRNGQNAGIVGAISPTGQTYSYANDIFLWGIWDLFDSNFLPDYGPFTDHIDTWMPAFANVSGKYFLETHVFPSTNENMCITTYNTFHTHGDPFLRIFTEVPQTIETTHDATITCFSPFHITAPEGSQIALTTEINRHPHILATAIGTGQEQELTVMEHVPGGIIHLTITGHNLLRHEEDIVKQPIGGPFVVVSDIGINGEELTTHYGHSVNADITLTNSGSVTSESGTVTMSSNSEYLDITHGEAAFAAIAPNASLDLDNAFTFTLGDNVPDKTRVPFTLTTHFGDENFAQEFNVTALSPNLTAKLIQIDDANGNNDGLLDPGEYATLTFRITNQGHYMASHPRVSLRDSEGLIRVITQEQTINTLGINAFAIVSFEIYVEYAAGAVPNVDLILSSVVNNLVTEEHFSCTVGFLVESFETGTFNTDYWTNDAEHPWVITGSYPFDGVYCAKSDTIDHNQSSVLTFTHTAIDGGIFSFYSMVSSENNYDFLIFYIDGEEQNRWSGDVWWAEHSYSVSPGQHEYKWEYLKDYSVDGGLDGAWIDHITLPLHLDNTADQAEAMPTIKLHPNPTTGPVSILGKGLKSAEVFNALGQSVATATGKDESITLDLSDLPAGVYFVNITDGEGRKCVRKVVKE